MATQKQNIPFFYLSDCCKRDNKISIYNNDNTSIACNTLSGSVNIKGQITFRCSIDILEIYQSDHAQVFLYTTNNNNNTTSTYNNVDIFILPNKKWIILYPGLRLQIGNKIYLIEKNNIPTSFSVLGKRSTNTIQPNSIFTKKRKISHNTHNFSVIESPNANRNIINLNNSQPLTIDLEDEYAEEEFDDEIVIKDTNTVGDIITTLLSIFPDLNESFIKTIAQTYHEQENAIQLACNKVMNYDDPPLKMKESKPNTINNQQSTVTDFSSQTNNYDVSSLYRNNMDIFLSNTFNCIPKSYINHITCKHRFNIIKIYEELQKKLKEEVDAHILSLKRTGNNYTHIKTSDDMYSYGFTQLTKLHFRFLKHKRANTRQNVNTLDNTFKKHLKVLQKFIISNQTKSDLLIAKSINENEYKQVDSLLDCPCCYEEYTFEDLTQCGDGHLFCIDCASKNAKVQLEEGKASHNLLCFQPGCTFPFSNQQIKRFLDTKTYQYYQKQALFNDIRNSKIDGLEHCPFCDFAMIIEDNQNNLFECKNPTCSIKSCRKCKKKSHIPKTCKEQAELENKSSIESKITNEMSEALVRECPKCNTRFFKETGCNKLTCPCGQSVCYICRKAISGYDHFAPKGKCALHGDTLKFNQESIEKAKKNALKDFEMKNSNKELIKVVKNDLKKFDNNIPSQSHNLTPDMVNIQHQINLQNHQRRLQQLQQKMLLTKKQYKKKPRK